jgi:periplasmic copper chaperone A
MNWRTLALIGCLLSASAAAAQTNGLEVKDAWARATAGKPGDGAVYLTIMSSAPDRLVSASAAVANKIDLMTTQNDNQTSKMVYLTAIDVPANKQVNLTPDGLHIWLAGLKQPLKAGETFPLTLNFEKAGQREITVSILPITARGPMNMDMKSMGNMDMKNMDMKNQMKK